jgi:hypothetical protein
MSSIDGHGLFVARFGQVEAPGILMEVAEMSNGVRQLKRIGAFAAEGHRLFVQRESGGAPPEISLDLAQPFQGRNERFPPARPTTERDGCAEGLPRLEQAS